MITVRNPTDASALTVVASEDLEVGQVVAAIQGTAAGEPVQVRAATVADLQDDTVTKGVVDYIPDDDLAVDFLIDPTQAGSSNILSLNTESDNTRDIPSGAACVMWYNKPIIGFHSSAVDAALDFSAVREGAKMAFDGDSAKLAEYNGGGVDGTEVFMGLLYRNEGPEITVVFTELYSNITKAIVTEEAVRRIEKMINNFRTASVPADKHTARLDALQSDFTKLLDEGGVSAIRARPDFQWRAAELVRQTVIDEFSMTDPTPLFVERRDARLGDKIEFERLINTLRVVRYAPQSHPQVFTPRKGKYTIQTAMYELAFGLPLQKILTRQHTVGEFVSMAAEAVTRHYAQLVLTAIDTACSPTQTDPKGRDVRTVAAGADVAEAEIQAALRQMVAVNSGVTIFGSRYALQPLMEYAKSEGGDAMKDEFQRRGVIGTYRGARLVVLEDDHNEYYNSWTTVNGDDIEKRLFLAAGQPGATLLERDLSALNWEELDQKKAQFQTGIRWDHGIFVHTPWRYHVVELQ